MKIGYTVCCRCEDAWRDYEKATAPWQAMGAIFFKRLDAELVMKAERLKAPSLEYVVLDVGLPESVADSDAPKEVQTRAV